MSETDDFTYNKTEMDLVIDCQFPGNRDKVHYYSNVKFVYLGRKYVAYWPESGFCVRKYKIGL